MVIKMIVPILKNYDYTTLIGYVNIESDKLKFTFNQPLSEKEIFDILGNIGYRIEEQILNEKGEYVIKSGEILCYSLISPQNKRA